MDETEIRIIPARGKRDIEYCAEWMSKLDPWLTLGIEQSAIFDRLTDPMREVHIAASDQAVGVVALVMRGALIGYINFLAVHPGWQNKGIGAQLLAYSERRIFQETPNVFLCVSSFNEGAQRFYKRHGYKIVGELKDFLVAGFSEYLMRKTVGPINKFTSSGSHRT